MKTVLTLTRDLDWLKEMFTDYDKIAHNATYDFGWLQAEGVSWNGRIIDTMITSLVDENKFSYSLNALAKEYLVDKKSDWALYEAAAQFGVDAKSEMYKMPATFVGEYAEQDAPLFKIMGRYKKKLQDDLQTV